MDRDRAPIRGTLLLLFAAIAALAGAVWLVNKLDDAVVADATALAMTAETAPPASPHIPGGSRLEVAVVGLDVPLLAMVSEDGVVEPPTAVAAYVVADHGVAPSRSHEGTVFIALHSDGAGWSAGAALIDREAQASALAPGDVIMADDVAYEVVETSVVAKDDVAADDELWDSGVANLLVLITCLPRDGEATHNVIAYAERIQ